MDPHLIYCSGAGYWVLGYWGWSWVLGTGYWVLGTGLPGLGTGLTTNACRVQNISTRPVQKRLEVRPVHLAALTTQPLEKDSYISTPCTCICICVCISWLDSGGRRMGWECNHVCVRVELRFFYVFISPRFTHSTQTSHSLILFRVPFYSFYFLQISSVCSPGPSMQFLSFSFKT